MRRETAGFLVVAVLLLFALTLTLFAQEQSYQPATLAITSDTQQFYTMSNGSAQPGLVGHFVDSDHLLWSSQLPDGRFWMLYPTRFCVTEPHTFDVNRCVVFDPSGQSTTAAVLFYGDHYVFGYAHDNNVVFSEYDSNFHLVRSVSYQMPSRVLLVASGSRNSGSYSFYVLYNSDGYYLRSFDYVLRSWHAPVRVSLKGVVFDKAVWYPVGSGLIYFRSHNCARWVWGSCQDPTYYDQFYVLPSLVSCSLSLPSANGFGAVWWSDLNVYPVVGSSVVRVNLSDSQCVAQVVGSSSDVGYPANSTLFAYPFALPLNRAPVLELNVIPPQPGTCQEFNVSLCSTYDPDGSITNYEYNVGGTVYDSTRCWFTYEQNAPGYFSFSARAEDDQNLWSAWKTYNVAIVPSDTSCSTGFVDAPPSSSGSETNSSSGSGSSSGGSSSGVGTSSGSSSSSGSSGSVAGLSGGVVSSSPSPASSPEQSSSPVQPASPTSAGHGVLPVVVAVIVGAMLAYLVVASRKR